MHIGLLFGFSSSFFLGISSLFAQGIYKKALEEKKPVLAALHAANKARNSPAGSERGKKWTEKHRAAKPSGADEYYSDGDAGRDHQKRQQELDALHLLGSPAQVSGEEKE